MSVPLRARVAYRLRTGVYKPVYSAMLSPLYGAVTHIATNKPYVALTFDDGPDERWTPQFLDLLARHGVEATFFCVGKAATQHREVLEAVARAGHALGSHSASHKDLNRLGIDDLKREVEGGHAALGDLAASLFRPPFGLYGIKVARVARGLGLDCILWNAHVSDWLRLPRDELKRRLIRALQPGGIVLLHDAILDPVPGGNVDRSELISVLDEVLATHGHLFEFVSVPRLLAEGRPVRSMFEGRTVPSFKARDLLKRAA